MQQDLKIYEVGFIPSIEPEKPVLFFLHGTGGDCGVFEEHHHIIQEITIVLPQALVLNGF